MGRPKSYDPEEKLELARRVFNERGFSATSITDLVDALGMNVKSLYAEFGSKQELFEAALRHHLRVHIGGIVGDMERDDAGLDQIRVALELWGAGGRSPAAGVGCLLCNTASERAALDEGAAKVVREYIDRLGGAFRNALSQARDQGALTPEVDVQAEARFFTSHALGQLTLARSNVAPEIAESAALVALRHLESLRRSGGEADSEP